MASGDAVQQIKDRLSIVDVISPYVELHPAGKNLKGKSPFTSEKTPSFYVSPERGMYYCFSSSQGGDMFTFVEKMEGVDFKGALKILADKANVELVPEDPKKRSERDTQYVILTEATKFCQDELKHNAEATAYLKDRGVEDKIITDWQIGYVPGPPKAGWRHMRDHLVALGYKDEALAKSGLVKSPGDGKAPYDTFRDRIMFPIRDVSGRVVAFSGRVLTKDSDAPKYVNSPETELFNKSEILYGYDKAKEGIRKFDFSLIVEGQFDVVLSHQAGYTNTVAVSGTALTPHHVALLQRLSNRVVLALDADRAGIAAVKRAADIMLARGMDLKVAELPDGQDPADLIRAGKGGFKIAIGHATHVIEFLLHLLLKSEKDSRRLKLKLSDEVLPYIVKLDSHIDRDHFIGIVADAVGVPKDAIALDVDRLEAKLKKASLKRSQTAENSSLSVPVTAERKHNREQAVLAYLCSVADILTEKERAVMEERLSSMIGRGIEEIKQEVPPDVASPLVFTLEADVEDKKRKHLYEDIVDRLNELSSISYKNRLRELTVAIKKAEEDEVEKEVESIMAEINLVQKKLSEEPILPDIFA